VEKKQVEMLEKAVADFRELNDKAQAESKKRGEESAEMKAQVEKANAEITKLQDEIKATNAALNRSVRGEAANQEVSAEQKARRDAFNKYIRKGDGSLSDMEQKALSVGSDPDGGFLVLPEMSSEIVKKVFESSPVRAVASVQTISSDSFEILQDLDEAGAGWVGETAARSETTTPQFKKIVIAVHEIYAKPRATQKLLDDAFVNIEAWLAEKVSERFGRIEATAFVQGDGVNKPRGFMTFTAGTSFGQIEQVNSGSAAVITADGIINLKYSLKGAYAPGAVFMMKRATVASVRKLKDTTNQYLWQPSLQLGQPDMLLGHPIYEADDMAVEAANALPIAFGNFKAGYQIVDRFGIRTLRDPYSAKPNVEFYTTKRVGGDVKDFEAIKILKCST